MKRQTWGRGWRGDGRHDAGTVDVPLLVIDDIGSSRQTDWAANEIAALIERRYAHALPTLVTTNQTLDQIADNIDARTASRLREDRNIHNFPPRDLRFDGSLRNGRADKGRVR